MEELSSTRNQRANIQGKYGGPRTERTGHAKSGDPMLQNATASGNQRRHLLTSLMNMSLVLSLP